MTMPRRAFLKRLLQAGTALAMAPLLPAVTAAPKPLAFHPDAFALMMAPLQPGDYRVDASCVDGGYRVDIYYGARLLQPTLACRVSA
jgi:hypothetical protein